MASRFPTGKRVPATRSRLNVSLVGENGAETIAPVWTTRCPSAPRPGTLYFTVADANTTNLTDFRQVSGRYCPHAPAR